MGKDQYLQYIPFTWIASNVLGDPVSAEVLQEMMFISMFNYQIDEYMEAVVGLVFRDRLDDAKSLIDGLFASTQSIWNSVLSPEELKASSTTEAGIRHILLSFVKYVLGHPQNSAKSSVAPKAASR